MASGDQEKGKQSGPNTGTTCSHTENHGHSFEFTYAKNTYTVSCDAPVTIMERLRTYSLFTDIYEKLVEKKKEIVIKREKLPKSAVAPHFPCCLIDQDECLDISFINSDGTKTDAIALHSKENLVCFYIKTTGEENIRQPMKNKELKRAVDYVCVYAVKKETIKDALTRDGRFNDRVLQKCLKEEGKKSITPLVTNVDKLGGKRFVAFQGSRGQSPATIKGEKCEVPVSSQKEKTDQNPSNAQEGKAEPTLEQQKSRKYPDMKEIPDTGEILEILRKQHGELLRLLKERENLKTNGEVKKFFRKEYDKSAQSFSEVKRLRQLIELSDFVCLICIDGSPRGTGFLFFDRFVITNFHVVEERAKCQMTAVFHYEELAVQDKMRVIPVKEIVAFCKGSDSLGNYLDFALLELSSNENVSPGLLKNRKGPPNRGGVCIIGHPGGGVKQMDPSFIIPKDGVTQAGNTHFKQDPNPEAVQIITKQWLDEDNKLHESQVFYNSCFFHGSSGSPVFDDLCNLIGVHTGGYVYSDKKNKTRSVIEYALPISPIIEQIRNQCKNNRHDVFKLLESLLESLNQKQEPQVMTDEDPVPMDS